MSIFRRLIQPARKEQHEQVIAGINVFILSLSGDISERARMFVKKLKYNQQGMEEGLFDWRYEIARPAMSPICSKIMNQNENYTAFRCYDCMESISSCICAECFANGDHRGHNYMQYQAINGCCDCGNDESWNQKGNCRHHGRSSEAQVEIQETVKDLYLKELRLAFWIYFHLCDSKRVDRFREQYGGALFNFLIKISSQNYQMKVLAHTLFSQPFPAQYGAFDKDKGSSIMHRIFKLKPLEELTRFVQLTFEIFPVQEFRIAVLQEYFHKTKKREEVMTRAHPLAMLNFQFLSCVKLINRLLKKKQLQPFQLYPYQYVAVSINLPEAFRKLYEDLDYIRNMKHAKEYHAQHLSLSNVCDLCFYRKFTTVYRSRNLEESQLMEYNLDELFLKTFGHFVKNIVEEKAIIEKSLMELMEYFSQADVNAVSLAHQRAFALLTYAYFDGDIYQLLSEETCVNFSKKIYPDSPIAFAIKTVVKNSLLSKLQIQRRSKYQMDYNEHQRYFLRLNPEKNFNEFLDVGFHKIMILLSRPFTDYSAILESTLAEVVQSVNMMARTQEIQESDTHQWQVYSPFYWLLNFVNTVTTVRVDQIVISNYIGVVKQKEIFEFLGRLLCSFKAMNIKEFKHFALSIINCEEKLESFIKHNCSVDKGKIKCNEEYEPLQTCLYDQIFKKYQKKLTEVQPYFLKKKIKLPEFQRFVVFNPAAIQRIMQFIMDYLFKITAKIDYSRSAEIFSLISYEFLKIYIEDNSIKEKSFFQTLLQPSFRRFIAKDLLEQITVLEKKEELENERGRIRDEKISSDQKRREKLLAKKKEKGFTLRETQKRILGNYEVDAMVDQNIENSNQCIYCKQNKQEQLNFISYVGLSNFYEQTVTQRQEDFHIYFQTCGHKIHTSCYDTVLMKNKSNYCFLCRRETNVLIPQFSRYKEVELGQSRGIDVINAFHAAVISQREEIKPELKETDAFLGKQDLNFHELLVVGLCRDMMFVGLQDYEAYRRSRELVHFQLCLLLKASNQLQMIQVYQKLREQPASHKFAQIERYIQHQLFSFIFNSQYEYDQLYNEDYFPIIDSFFLNFTKLSQNPQTSLQSSQTLHLKFFNPSDLFISLPQNLSQMSLFIGQCKLCKHLTNFIYICLKCNWSCCRKCLSLMYKHSTYQHLDGTIFISCTNGAVKYLHNGRIYEDDSIYQNYLGENYMEVTSQAELMKYQKFTVNHTKVEVLMKMALQYGIHQKIFINDH